MRFLRQFRNSFIFLAIILLIPFILLQVSAAAEQPRFPSELEAGSQDIRSANLEVAALLPVFRNDRHDPPPGDGPLFGVNFINSAEDLADEIQFQNGLATGASWNRWPIYWFNVETSSGSYDWATQDLALRGDIAHGLQTNAILLGTPGCYTTSNLTGPDALKTTSHGMFEMLAPQAAAPVGLYEPVFSDGTDIPGSHKQINPNNKWARFTEMAVDRYKQNNFG